MPNDTFELTDEEKILIKEIERKYWERQNAEMARQYGMSVDDYVEAERLASERAARIAEENKKSMDDFLADIHRMVEERAEHTASCTERYCDLCGRKQCVITSCDALRYSAPDAPSSRSNDYCVDHTVQYHLSKVVPIRYRDAYQQVATRVRAWASSSRVVPTPTTKSVVLVGPTGSGKSSLASAMLAGVFREQVENGRLFAEEGISMHSGVEWIAATDIATAVRTASFGEEIRLVEGAKHCALLVLDDLGAESSLPSVRDAIVEIIHDRHDAERRTWITTGFAPNEIASRYSGAVERRIFEGATIIDCATPRRQNNGAPLGRDERGAKGVESR